MATQTFIETLTVLDCCTCGLTFGITQVFEERRRGDHKSFYCPVGHPQSYHGKSEAEKAREELRRMERQRNLARSDAEFYRIAAAHERRSAAAHKGHATRIRNLIAKGVCPVPGCRRNFANVKDHIATQHPNWHQHEGDES